MPNTVQLTQNGQPVYPVTDVSLITGLEERSGMRVIPYTTRPTASAETAGFIYMDESTLDLYVTKATSGSYSWVSAGNLSNINLDNYATKTELEQLGQEVNGKYLSDYVPKIVLYGSGTGPNPRYNADWITTGKIPVSENDVVKVVFNRAGASSHNIVTLYDATDATLGGYSSSGYTNVRDNMVMTNSSVSYIRCCMDYTNRERGEVYVNGELVWKYEPPKSIDERLTELEQSTENIICLPISDLVQAGLTSGVPNPSASAASMRVSVNSAVCFPKHGEWHIRLPFGLYVAIAGFNSSVGGVTDSGWLSDGDTYQVSTQQVYRCVFKVGTGNQSLPVDYIKELVAGGQIAIYADSEDKPIAERNAHRQDELQAMRRVLVSPSSDNKADALPLFAHISDLHGDIQRLYNCLDYCSGIKPIAVLNSGDVVVYRGDRDYSTFQVVAAKQYALDYLFCIGNHEASLTGQSDLFDKNISALAQQYEYLATPGIITTDCYYYKDYEAEKVRIIVLNYYDEGTYTGRLGQAQITWLCNTLSSTPTGYGILIMLHSPEDYVDAPEGLQTFFQTKSIVGAMAGVSVGGRIVMKIVDSFISRGTISESYNESNGDPVTVSADFSSVDSSTEFVAYITGHRHEDNVGYYRHSTNMQLCLCVTSGNALYGDSTNPAWANQEDLPRGGTGVCQDAFNLYAIDRINKRVKIMRVGADITADLESRKIMSIPYVAES